MVTIGSLWLAIALSGVLVWVASAIVWMALPHHKSDFRGLPDEAAARAALQPQNLAPGQYDIPHFANPQKDAATPEGRKKFEDGPAAFITVLPRGMPAMGGKLVLQFVYYLTVSFIVAYLVSRTLDADTHYLGVFRVAGTIAWLAYGWGVVQDAIWFGRPWSAVAKHLGDALIYALLTGGIFGWQYTMLQ